MLEGEILIKAIADLGKWSLKQTPKSYVDIQMDWVDIKTNFHLVLLNVDTENERVFIHIEELSPEKFNFLLYKRGPSNNGPNYSPTVLVKKKGKSFLTKIMQWFKWVERNSNAFDSKSVKFTENVHRIMTQHQNDIYNQLINDENIPKKDLFVSVRVDGKYPREINEWLVIIEKLIRIKEQENSSHSKVCSVCGQIKPLILAGSTAFKFYTIDKPGFITGGFEEKQSWRNYPVCSECNLHLLEGRRILEQNLRFTFCGIPYLLVPEFLFIEDESHDDIMEVLLNQKKRLGLDEQSKRDFLASKEEILFFLQEASEHLMLHFFFIKRVQAADRILLLIDDVVPSRLQELFKAKERVEKKFYMEDETEEPPKFNFGSIRPFFKKSDENKSEMDLDNYFLKMVESVFHGKNLDQAFVIGFFMKELRRLLLEDSNKISSMVFNSMMSLQYFYELGIMKAKGDDRVSSRLDELFNKYTYYDTPEKKGLFLLGALTQQLLALQQEVRGAQPFKKQLKGYKMLEEDFRGLLADVSSKFDQYEGLEEYPKYAKARKVLTEEVSQLLGSASGGWKLSVDEMNYCFVTGMSLRYQVIKLLQSKEN